MSRGLFGLVSRAQRGAEYRAAEPGPTRGTYQWVPALRCTASLTLRAAPRPGHEAAAHRRSVSSGCALRTSPPARPRESGAPEVRARHSLWPSGFPLARNERENGVARAYDVLACAGMTGESGAPSLTDRALTPPPARSRAPGCRCRSESSTARRSRWRGSAARGRDCTGIAGRAGRCRA